MSVDLLDRRGVHHQTLYEIVCTVPDTRTFRFSSMGGGYVDTSYRQYQPFVIQDGDIPQDNDGFIRTSLIVSNHFPVADPVGNKSYPTFADLLRAYQLEHATIRIYHLGEVGSETPQKNQRLNGHIVEVSNVSQASVTLEVEQRADLGNSYAPQKTIAAGDLSPLLLDDVPQRSKGKAFPLAFGRAVSYVPEEVYAGMTDSDIIQKLNRCGIKPRGFPAVPYRETTEYVYNFWTEKISGGLEVEDFAASSARNAFVYFPEADAYAIPYETSGNVLFGTQAGRGYYCRLKRAPILRVPFICSQLSTGFSNLSDGEKAVDGKPETYATLAPSGTGYWDIPSMPDLGRIVYNTNNDGTADNDFEGVGYPAGIQVFCLLVRVPPDGVPAAESAKLSMSFPTTFSGDELFGDFVIPNFPAANWEAAVTRSPVRVATTGGGVGSHGNGWYGTQFYNWKLNAGKYDAAGSGGNTPVSHSDNGNNTKPMRVKLENLSAENLRVVSVGVEIGFEYAKRSVGSKVLYERFAGNNAGRRRYIYTEDEEQKLRVPRGERVRIPDIPHDSIDNLFISSESYEDDTDGKYTDTGFGDIDKPTEFAHYLMEEYASLVNITTSDTSHGGAYAARSVLDWWATRGGGGATSPFRTIGGTTEKTSVGDLIQDMFRELPGSSIVRSRLGHWHFHVWGPKSEQPTDSIYRSALDPKEALVMNDEGLQFTTSGGSSDDVVNQIRVEYDQDPGSGEYARTATLLWSEADEAYNSDDGYGNAWPGFPGGVTVEDLALYSKDHYGLNPPKTIKLPWVIDRETALGIGMYRLARRWQPPRRIAFEGRTCFHDLDNFHLIQFDNTLDTTFGLKLPWFGIQADSEDGGDWVQNYWRVDRLELQSNPERTYLIEAEWIPTELIGGPLQAGKGGMVEPDFHSIELGPLG